jgi:hypothetical protein
MEMIPATPANGHKGERMRTGVGQRECVCVSVRLALSSARGAGAGARAGSQPIDVGLIYPSRVRRVDGGCC